MIIFEDLGLVYKKGKEDIHGFLLGSTHDYINKKIVLMGTGENSALCTILLNKKGLDVYAYCDNNSDMQHRNFLGKEVRAPKDFLGLDDANEKIFFIATMLDFTYVTMQFAINCITTYSYFFTGKYFDSFDESNKNTVFLKGISNVINQKYKSTELLDAYNTSKTLLTSIGWWKPVFSWVYDRLTKANQQLSVLEIGPGHGLMSYLMVSMNPDIQLDWIDIPNGYWEKYDNKEKTVLDVGDKSFTVNLHLGEIENPSFILKNKYDIIVMTEVFEHIRINPVPVFQRIASYLKDNGGELFISTPNWPHLPIYDSWKDMMSYTEFKNMENTFLHTYFSHSYHYSYEELNEIFELCSLKVVNYDLSTLNNHNFLLTKK